LVSFFRFLLRRTISQSLHLNKREPL